MCYYSHFLTGRRTLSTSYLPFISSSMFIAYSFILILAALAFPEAVHHVSVSINVSHSMLVCGEAWGTDPRFNWLHERVAITQTVGRVFDNGTTLLVTMTPMCGHFTCTVSNKVSHGSATYTAGRMLYVAIVCLCCHHCA